MKRLFTLLVTVAISISFFAQSPQKMSYQAVIRNSSGQLVANHDVGMRISILQGSATGTPVYVETQTPTTNANGLAMIEIGGGTVVTGTFTGINWATGLYFIKTETDPAGGTSYIITGTSQILSVPYALYAKTSGNGSLWSQNGSNIYYNSGKVGAGISSPATYFHAHGVPVTSRGQLSLSAPAGQGTFISFYEADIFKAYLWFDASNQDLRLQNYTAGNLNLNPYGGNVGIGTNTPSSKLDVKGEINVNSYKIINVADPSSAQDAATKAYVDAILSKLSATGSILADADGNIYSTVRIGSQVWMDENLKTTKYNDGSDITMVTDSTQWLNLTTPGYCWYDNNEMKYKSTYGALYNWYVVSTGKLCPSRWHVPTDDEWTTLQNYLIANGYNYDGTTTDNKIAKALASASGWTSSPNIGAVGNTDYPVIRNATGFTALPGGKRVSNGAFSLIGDIGTWWPATEFGSTSARGLGLKYDIRSLINSSYYNKKHGFSVRCLRD